ncbi:hypothetical protein KRX54_03790 [Actinomycetaceae bacterium TAE3-ERU4]|nr:hypothetical protein [Actinomycetaceae bacterium TAE3-ERU4]
MDYESLGVDAQAVALALAVKEIEQQASQVGWDHPPTVYALVKAKQLLADPQLPEQFRGHLESQIQVNEEYLVAVVQEDLSTPQILETLEQLAWPEEVCGMAVSLERVSVPPEVEAQAPADSEAAATFFANHESREEIRICAGALRTGQTWCAIRSRAHDSEESVVEGSEMIPDLSQALLATFAPEEE